MYDFGHDKIAMGLEVSGVVAQVGSKVTHLAVGDRVAGFCATGCFSTRPVLNAMPCVKIPDDLGYEDAAIITGVFISVVYSLLDIGQLKSDQVSWPRSSMSESVG